MTRMVAQTAALGTEPSHRGKILSPGILEETHDRLKWTAPRTNPLIYFAIQLRNLRSQRELPRRSLERNGAHAERLASNASEHAVAAIAWGRPCAVCAPTLLSH